MRKHETLDFAEAIKEVAKMLLGGIDVIGVAYISGKYVIKEGE